MRACVCIFVGGSQGRRGAIIEFHSRGGKQARRKAKERKDPRGHGTCVAAPCGLTGGACGRVKSRRVGQEADGIWFQDRNN